MPFLLVAICIVLALIAGDVFLPSYASSLDLLAAPGAAHLLGTNDLGQDVLIGLIHAGVPTIAIALSTAGIALLIALSLSALGLVFGGAGERILLSLIDLLQIIPNILVLLLVATWTQPDAFGLVILLGFTTWQDDVRVLVRVMQRQLARESVKTARIMGASWWYCILFHVLPAMRPVLAGLYIQNIIQAAMRCAGLAFLGLTDPRLPTWGAMMQDATPYLYSAASWWLLGPPLLAFVGFVLLLLAISRRFEVAP